MIDDEEMAALQAELDDTMEWLGELNEQIGALDRILGPFYERKQMIDTAITRTHEWISAYDAKVRDWRMGRHGQDVVVGWRRQGVERRTALWIEMQGLVTIYGKSRSERTQLAKDRRKGERSCKTLRAVIGRETKRRMRREAA
jgi:hypothetical protein